VGNVVSKVFVSLCTPHCTVPAIAMLPVRDTAIATQNGSPQFEQCSCSVPLVIPNTVLFVCDRVTDVSHGFTGGVVTTLKGNPAEKPTHTTAC
jgi:hypothetical protein